MAFDRGALPRVAWLALASACGPSFKPPAPPPEPTPVVRSLQNAPTGGGRQLVVGEMCLQGAGGRPAVDPLIMRGVQWTDNVAEVDETVERGSVPRFAVFGVDGKLAGAFDTLGLVDIGPSQSVASGTYVGAAPCTYELAAKPTPGQLAMRAEDPKCAPATGGCGLAVGEVMRPDDPAETPAFSTGGACVSGDQLAVDIDGDGRVELFPLAGALDGIRGPASEWTAGGGAGAEVAACKPQFQLYDIRLTAEQDPGKPVDPKSLVMMDVLGVLDLDGDGRRDLVIALRFPTVRSIVVYSASGNAQRLELVGEATSFPH